MASVTVFTKPVSCGSRTTNCCLFDLGVVLQHATQPDPLEPGLELLADVDGDAGVGLVELVPQDADRLGLSLVARRVHQVGDFVRGRRADERQRQDRGRQHGGRHRRPARDRVGESRGRQMSSGVSAEEIERVTIECAARATGLASERDRQPPRCRTTMIFRLNNGGGACYLPATIRTAMPDLLLKLFSENSSSRRWASAPDGCRQVGAPPPLLTKISWWYGSAEAPVPLACEAGSTCAAAQ